jgi:hypothetical protein
MKILYVATDLEIESASDLSALVKELGGAVCVHQDQWHGDVYRVAVGLAGTNHTPANDVEAYCSLLSRLSPEAKAMWDGCSQRVFDVAFESGSEPTSSSYRLPAVLVGRVAEVGAGLTVTIYKIGAYSDG